MRAPARAPATGRAPAAGVPRGLSCAQAGCQATTGIITGAGTCDGAGHCSTVKTKDCNGFRCYTDPGGMAQCGTDCSRDPECALDFYCSSMNDGGTADAGPDGGSGSTCPAVFDLGHACTRNAQCNSGSCSDGVCCNINCDKCGSCNLPATLGTCVPITAGTDPEGECQDNASDPTGLCKGFCNGQARCTYVAAGTTCGTCKACNGVGLCNIKPEDDGACGTIDCDGLNTQCLEYDDLTTKRCGALGVCKPANNAASCTVFTNTCTGTGGSGGTGTGGRGGSSGGGGGSAGTAGSTGGSAARGGTTGTAGSTTGSAGATGTDGGTAGTAGGGGGGCCSVGGADTPNGVVGLLVLRVCLAHATPEALRALSKNDGTHDATIDRRHGGAVGPGDLPEGMEVGEYRVQRKIGEGGMGVGLRRHPARSSASASRSRCWRRTSRANPELVRRFVDEARAVNKIGHPNIVDIFSFGRLPDRRHYFAMEFLDGQSLADRIKQRAVPARRGAAPLAPDLPGAGGGAPAGDRPPRSQARQHLDRAAAARRLVRASCSTSASPS